MYGTPCIVLATAELSDPCVNLVYDRGNTSHSALSARNTQPAPQHCLLTASLVYPHTTHCLAIDQAVARRTLQELIKREELDNKKCIDCSNPNPQWASLRSAYACLRSRDWLSNSLH